MNKVILLGNLTKDVELRNTPSGKAVATVSMATNKRWTDKDSGQKQERVEFHNLVIWRGGEVFAQYTGKGSKVLIEGELQTTNWVDKETGKKMYKTEINVKEFTFLDSKKTGGQEQAPVEHPFNKEEVSDEEIKIEDIPF